MQICEAELFAGKASRSAVGWDQRPMSNAASGSELGLYALPQTADKDCGTLGSVLADKLLVYPEEPTIAILHPLKTAKRAIFLLQKAM